MFWRITLNPEVLAEFYTQTKNDLASQWTVQHLDFTGPVGTLVRRTQHSQILTRLQLLLEQAEEPSLRHGLVGTWAGG